MTGKQESEAGSRGELSKWFELDGQGKVKSPALPSKAHVGLSSRTYRSVRRNCSWTVRRCNGFRFAKSAVFPVDRIAGGPPDTMHGLGGTLI